MIDAGGIEHTYWGGETGTAEFYTVTKKLKAYLVGDDILVYHPTPMIHLLIENDDEGCDKFI